MKLIDCLKQFENGNIAKCEGKFLHISCGEGLAELKLTPALLQSEDWGVSFEASGDMEKVLSKVRDSLERK